MDSDVKDIIKIAEKAGKAIMEVYAKDFAVEYKAEKHPVTEADKKSNSIIVEELKKRYPAVPIIAEESKQIPYEERKDYEYFWLVDPLDGTKDFIKKNDEFTVNIALVHKDTPVLGVVHIPAQDLTYYAQKRNGAFKIVKGKKEKIDGTKKTEFFTIVVSRSHLNDDTLRFIEKEKKDKEVVVTPSGSSIKFCLVAEGKADIYPRLGHTMEWDTGAPHIVLKEAGKNIYNYKTGEELKYNKESLVNPYFIVK